MSNGIWDWKLVGTILFGAYLLFGGILVIEGFTEEGIRLIIRWTARFSVSCFALAFAGSAIHKIIQNSFSFWIFRNRKFFGISFALLHLTHLAAIVALQIFFHPVFVNAATFSLVAGGGAYLFLILMLLTSFERFRALLSFKQWKLLHTVGGYWIFVVFFSNYFKRVWSGDFSYLPLLSLLIIVLGLRVWKLINSKKENRVRKTEP